MTSTRNARRTKNDRRTLINDSAQAANYQTQTSSPFFPFMAAPLRISSTFLNNLKASFPEQGPTTVFSNPWYIIAAVAFSASNRPEAVQPVFLHALDDLRSGAGSGIGGTQQQEGGSLVESSSDTPPDQASSSNLKANERLLAHKLREALFKSGLVSGYPRAINALLALHAVTPEDLQDSRILRQTDLSLPEYEERGMKNFKNLYGETAENVQGLLDGAYPDMGWFSKTIGYGVTYGQHDILTSIETSYTLVAALISGDTPQQITWHLNGALRAGGTLEQVRAVRSMSIEVARHAGVKWMNDVPEV